MNESPTIDVHLNGEERAVPGELTVWALLEWFDLNPSLVVVELNREILDRNRYAEIPVEAGDVLEFVHFVGGG